MTTICDVRDRGNGLWRITDANGVDYTTRNMWLASLADQYRKKGTPVEITADDWYRRLTAITPAPAEQRP